MTTRDETAKWPHEFLGRCVACLDNAYLDSDCEPPPWVVYDDCLVRRVRVSRVKGDCPMFAEVSP